MGGRGATSGGGSIAQAIKNAKSGNLGTTREAIKDIASSPGSLDTSRLSESERAKLIKMVRNNPNNDESVIQSIKDGDIARINFSEFSSKDLESFVRMAGKIRTYASIWAMQDALMVLSWRNQSK